MVINRVFDEVLRTWSNVAVLRALINSNKGFSGNEVARLSGMQPRSAFKALTLLEKLGLINRQIGGRDHIFRINNNHYLIQNVFKQLYVTEYNFYESLVSELASIVKNDVKSALIFGSVARREENVDSDLDLFLLVNSLRCADSLREKINHESISLNEKYGIKLSVIIFTMKEFKQKLKSKLIKKILDEGILISGKHPSKSKND